MSITARQSFQPLSSDAREARVDANFDGCRIFYGCDDDVELPDSAAHFGFLATGGRRLESESGGFDLREWMYFAVPGAARIAGRGDVLVVSVSDHRPFFHLGGPIESTGRLRYINGCTDSLLIPPVVKGDPCLNLLHIPPGVDQSPHTHPSIRIGVVVEGAGVCRTPEGDHPLAPGLAWVVHANCLHSFHTADEPLLITAFHPDSDFGPTHEDHPMLNRTVIEERRSTITPTSV